MIDWEEVVWHVYQTGSTTRVEAPRTHHVVTRDRNGKVTSREKHSRPLRDHELNKTRTGKHLLATSERFVMAVTGLSRRTIEHLIRQHGISGLKEAVANLDLRQKSKSIAETERRAAFAAEFAKKPDLGPQPQHPDQNKPAEAPSWYSIESIAA